MSSAVKYTYPTYKLFEPQYQTQRPIIIDADAIESPDTVTLRYEEEAAARRNGGGLRGDSPPGLLGIESCVKQEPPPMHSFESPRSYQDTQYQYAGQSFSSQQSDNAAAAQLNHLAFAANSSASPYMSTVVPTIISYQPTSGVFGTKIAIKFSAAYDLIAVASQFSLVFGAHKSPAHATRDASDASGLGFVVCAEAPQLDDTRSASGNVPISLLIESAEGEMVGNTDVGTFTYHDAPAVGAEGSHGDITRRPSSKQHHQHHQQHEHEQHEADQLAEAAAAAQAGATNTYPYAPTPHQQAVASNYDATGYPSTTSQHNMLSTYHRPSYGADYPRAPPSMLKHHSHSHSHAWASLYGPPLTSPRSPHSMRHHAKRISRSAAVESHHMNGGHEPRLKRTSTIQAAGPLAGSMYTQCSSKATLKINGDLESMANNWNAEECSEGRRIVQFFKKQQGTTLTASFKSVSVNNKPPQGNFVSCIYWAEKHECYVTSVDTIALLDKLLTGGVHPFNVDEKNRIRRNLEGYRPLTVSKTKPESEAFFKVIMGFGIPKPRNIEKDVKVFPWKKLAPALQKIVSKYSVDPEHLPGPPPSSSGPYHSLALTTYHHPTTGAPGIPSSSALLTPVSSITSPGIYGPPPLPPHTPTLADTYGTHHDAQTMASPRSLSGAPSSWVPYTSSRGLSPSLKSPQTTGGGGGGGGGIRIPSLPAYSYGMGAAHRWDANGYGDASTTPTYASHAHSSHVYGGGAYSSSSAHHRE
ncbi:hypothetical protein F4808DRAFT_454152 [Astrocystis sublimbata]|nr:hypothetical protein F4808DRAFT_454152 [Astrocystis sublimbata]